ncbi:MAG: YceI family protein [Betaproteobacteria bacterium]|nr:YceI family protein [Betaproteobacteria bacterium]
MKKFLMYIALLGIWLPAHATAFNTVVQAQSSVTFVSHQMGVAVPGKFTHFTALIYFDPNAPQISTAQVNVATASVDAGSAEANGTLQDKDWFDVRDWPQASFSTRALSGIGNGNYRANGILSIKGKARPVTVQFHATPITGGMMLEGDLPISRATYGIGGGEWAAPSVVGDEVSIHFRFILK